MTGFYDWFILLVAIPGMGLTLTGLIALWMFILHDIWVSRR